MTLTITELVSALLGIITAIVVGCWRLFHFVYKNRIDTKDEKIQSLEETVRDLKSELESEREKRAYSLKVLAPPLESPKEQPPYDPYWEQVDRYTLWQAAWLWKGKKPSNNITESSEAYPVLMMRSNAVVTGRLARDPLESYPRKTIEITNDFKVSRSELRSFAEKQTDERPTFLFPDKPKTVEDLL